MLPATFSDVHCLKTWGLMFPPCFLWIFVCLLFFLVLLVSQNRYIIASPLPSSSPLPAFTIIRICECTILAIWRIRLNFPWPSLPPPTFVPPHHPLLKSVSEPSSPLSSNPVTIEVSTLFFFLPVLALTAAFTKAPCNNHLNFRTLVTLRDMTEIRIQRNYPRTTFM